MVPGVLVVFVAVPFVDGETVEPEEALMPRHVDGPQPQGLAPSGEGIRSSP